MDMKKVFAGLLLFGVAWSAGAQNWQDAYSFSENNYVGTARSVGMGNAMTAIGGDLGSLSFNPAGSAVAGYSQITLTPSLSIATTSAKGDIVTDKGESLGFGDAQKAAYTRFKMPNFGFMTVFDTHNNQGLKRWSFGLVGNATNDYTYQMRGAGINPFSTFAGALASEAGGWTVKEMTGGWFQSGNMPSWRAMTAYYGGLIDPLSVDGSYIGLTEILKDDGSIEQNEPVYQQYGRRQRGNKYDLLLNFAANFSDKFYLGANLGIASLSFRSEEYWIESPAYTDAPFPVDYDGVSGEFQNLRMKYQYQATGSGVFAKFGFIARPFAGLRIGAAIQTPTVMQLKERYGYSASSNVSGLSRERVSRSSEEGDWSYELKSPLRLNAGIAYTLGSVGLVSVDYEFANFGSCRYRTMYYDDDYDFSYTNKDIKENLGVSHQLRAGLEIRPVPVMALRLGYNLITGAEKGFKANRQNFSVGVGYTGGNFFADLGVRMNLMPKVYSTPYNYYSWFYENKADGKEYEVDNIMTVDEDEIGSWCVQDVNDVPVPRIAVVPRLFDVIATVGLRF